MNSPPRHYHTHSHSSHRRIATRPIHPPLQGMVRLPRCAETGTCHHARRTQQHTPSAGGAHAATPLASACVWLFAYYTSNPH
ncbi:hypothetical protein K437DRAFT_140814 [Tilletiaria anomala UBC 951]|uniref:Uncharacterized protein n=1 Tax=Tilletiaria anomala (strain ATCC 24038 / CBS 436.72 / UBC 951) TaxID=1037660 RepID=A0A066VZX7_TILAU|nr:uncharacterized protein K437DRAFT_140814 [Tilletiaria anomala UBC 951]KDN44110.1 hypothetical protein K437DRAFT_140814 [Tilletiaria anomala UBC 951]